MHPLVHPPAETDRAHPLAEAGVAAHGCGTARSPPWAANSSIVPHPGRQIRQVGQKITRKLICGAAGAATRGFALRTPG